MTKDEIPHNTYDGFFTANTFHIMSLQEVELGIKNIGVSMPKGAQFLVYGPFNFKGKFTSESNRNFDQMLRDRDPKQGIRDFEKIDEWFLDLCCRVSDVVQMPANNFILVFEKC